MKHNTFHFHGSMSHWCFRQPACNKIRWKEHNSEHEKRTCKDQHLQPSNEVIVSKTITQLRSKLFSKVSYDEQGDNLPCLDLPEDLNLLYNKLRRKVTSEEKGKYRSYAEKVKKIPYDFKEKVQTLHDMGYHYDDCEAALRSSDYDLERAVNYLLYMNQNNDDSDSDIGELLSNLLENHVL